MCVPAGCPSAHGSLRLPGVQAWQDKRQELQSSISSLAKEKEALSSQVAQKIKESAVQHDQWRKREQELTGK